MSASAPIRVLAIIAIAIVLSLGSALFVPLALGLLLAALLHPPTSALRQLHIPAPLAAAVAVICSILLIALAVTLLEPPVRTLGRDLPRTLVAARGRLESLGIRLPGGPGSRPAAPGSGRAAAPVSGVRADSSASGPEAARTPARPDSSTARSSSGGSETQSFGIGQTLTRAFGVTLGAVFALIEVLLLAFFILAGGDGWIAKIRRATRSPEQCERVLDSVREVRHVVMRYLLMNVLINAAQGVVVALVVWPLGYAAPLVWGVLTFIAEFVPYFGGAVMVGLLFLTGLAAGQGLGHAIVAPVAYLVITTLQNNLVSPAAYGRGLRLNPTAILVGVMFWGLVWGIAGVFLAVPLLAALRIVMERDESFAPVAAFLAD